MFPNWSGWKTVKLILFILVAADGGVLSATDLPANVMTDAHGVGTALGVIGMIVVALSGSSAGPALARTAAKMTHALMLTLGAFVLFVMLPAACSGCGAGTAGQVVATGVAVGPLAECIYQHVDQCITDHTPWTTCTEQTAAACGVDVPSVVSIWASKRASEVREGIVVAPNDAGIP